MFFRYDLLVETARKTSLLGFGRLGELLSTIDDLLSKLYSLKVRLLLWFFLKVSKSEIAGRICCVDCFDWN
jgi:hypothetical protein